MRRTLLLSALLAAATALVPSVSIASAAWNESTRPIDPAYLTSLPFGTRSHWIQPWRAYLDTPPATALRDGMGMNFNVTRVDEAVAAARLLGASGIRRARIEISWTGMSYADPTAFSNAGSVRSMLVALRDAGIRPLILLNANDAQPGPARPYTAMLTASAAAGARTVHLDAASAALVVPRLTGITDGGLTNGALITGVAPDGTATLSHPLTQALSAGAHGGMTYRYEPFAGPQLADGSPNPRFEATMRGWLDYVGAVTHLARQVIGSDAFDVEVWNELGFGSRYLDIANYYSPLPDVTTGSINTAILRRTVDFLRDPANGTPGIGIGNGFASQTPWDSGAGQLPGVTAFDRHPYHQDSPAWAQPFNGIRPLNALLQPDYTVVNGANRDRFVPQPDAYMPEWFLTGQQTETIIRDIAPMTTAYGGTRHGRNTAPAGGAPPQVWVTETGMDPETARYISPTLTPGDKTHMKAKAALRTYVSFINKGVTALDLFAVRGAPSWNNVPDAFFAQARATNGAGPGLSAGGETMDAVRRLAATVSDARPITQPRALELRDVADDHDHAQFTGDGTAAHPSLYDREVLGFFPFQLDAHRFVAGVYVMTRSIVKIQQPGLPTSDPRRTDLPQERFRVTIGGLDGPAAQVSATDPLTGEDTAATVVSTTADSVTVQLEATDSPRMLSITDGPPDPGSQAPSAPTAPDPITPAPSTPDPIQPTPSPPDPTTPTPSPPDPTTPTPSTPDPTTPTPSTPDPITPDPATPPPSTPDPVLPTPPAPPASPTDPHGDGTAEPAPDGTSASATDGVPEGAEADASASVPGSAAGPWDAAPAPAQLTTPVPAPAPTPLPDEEQRRDAGAVAQPRPEADRATLHRVIPRAPSVAVRLPSLRPGQSRLRMSLTCAIACRATWTVSAPGRRSTAGRGSARPGSPSTLTGGLPAIGTSRRQLCRVQVRVTDTSGAALRTVTLPVVMRNG